MINESDKLPKAAAWMEPRRPATLNTHRYLPKKPESNKITSPIRSRRYVFYKPEKHDDDKELMDKLEKEENEIEKEIDLLTKQLNQVKTNSQLREIEFHRNYQRPETQESYYNTIIW